MTVKSYAKVNIFLKITGTRGNYHELFSRFVRVKDLYDTLTFSPKEKPGDAFELRGSFGCPTEKNTIYKAFLLLKEYTQSKRLVDFMEVFALHVEKNIPEFAGLGGGSSNAAAFMNACNKQCDLKLDIDTLSHLGAKIGADVPFFIHDYNSANVSGIGEIVTPFEENPPAINTFTPPIKGDTADVYKNFRKHYLTHLYANGILAKKLETQSSENILKHYEAIVLNDLLAPALTLYPKLKDYAKEGWFFSGSGSTFFTLGNR